MTVRLSNEDANETFEGIAFRLVSTDKRYESLALVNKKAGFRYTKLDLAVKQKLKYEVAMPHDALEDYVPVN